MNAIFINPPKCKNSHLFFVFLSDPFPQYLIRFSTCDILQENISLTWTPCKTHYMHIYINIYCERQRECHKNKKLIHDTSTKHPQGQIIIYIQWAQTKLVHMTLGNTNVLCTSLVCAHCIHGMEWNGMMTLLLYISS